MSLLSVWTKWNIVSMQIYYWHTGGVEENVYIIWGQAKNLLA